MGQRGANKIVRLLMRLGMDMFGFVGCISFCNDQKSDVV